MTNSNFSEKAAAIKTRKEGHLFYAVAIDGQFERSDADVMTWASSRSEALKAAKAELKDKGYKVVPQWKI